MRAHHETHQTRFFTLFAVAIAGVMAVAYSANLFTLFIFYEFLTVSTYPLVTHSGSEDAKRGGRKYIFILMGSSILFFLPAMIITWYSAGTLDFAQGGILAGNLSPAYVLPLLLLFILGIGKAGVMPLASFIALTKDNLKERLAYSTVSQLSYIVLGAMLANHYAIIGASMHIAMHAFAKIALFFAAGAILVTMHKTKVSELSGLGLLFIEYSN